METMVQEYRENIHLLQKMLPTMESEVEQQEIQSMIGDLRYGIQSIQRASKAPRLRKRGVRSQAKTSVNDSFQKGLFPSEVLISTKRCSRPRKKVNRLTLLQFLRIQQARVSTFHTRGVAQDYWINNYTSTKNPLYVGRAIRLDTRESISLVRLYYQLRNVRTFDNKLVLAKRTKPNDVLRKVRIPVKARRRRQA